VYGTNPVVTYPVGKVGNGIKLDGISQYVKVPYNTLLNPNYLSIAMWVRMDGNTGIAATLIQKYNPGSSWPQFAISYGTTPSIQMITGGTARSMSGLTAWSDSGWHFIALTYDGVWLKFRCDETVLRQAQTGTLNPYTSDMFIGAWYQGGVMSSFFNGMIDELMISGRGWSDEELDLIYNSGRGRKYLETVASRYAINGGRSTALVTPTGFKAVDLTLDANMISGNTYSAGVIALSGIVDAYGVKFDEVNRSATFDCYDSIRTHPTLYDSSLCGAWLLDGDATDSSGNGYHGTVGGTPSYVAGMVGQGLNFAAGAGNTVWVNPMYLERKTIGNTSKFAIACWAKFNAISGTAQYLVSKRCTEAMANTDQLHWGLYKDASNNILFEMPTTAITGPAATTSWVHLACGYDGRTMVLYVNGVLYATATNVQPRPKETFPLIPIRIGGCSGDVHPPYPLADVTYVPNAIVNQVLHFNRLLTADEVKSLHGAGNGLVW
jgi:hypothetical protein